MGRDSSELRGRVLFLVGARRSGTNWFQALLAVHPRIATAPSETHLLYTLGELQARFQHGLIGSPTTGTTYLPRAEMLDGFRDLCDRVFAIQLATGGPGVEILVERTPWHAHHLDLIGEVYPDAHVVHLIRDGHAVAASLARQPWGPASLTDAAQEWVDTVARARSNPPARYHEVRYEALRSDPAGELDRLFGEIGLHADDQLLASVRQTAERPVNATPGTDPTAGPTWQETLGPAELVQIEAVAGDLLSELGYPLAAPVPSRPAAGRVGPDRPGSRMVRRVAVLARRTPHARRARPGETTTHRKQWVIDRMLEALEASDAVALESLLGSDVVVTLHNCEKVLRAADGLDVVAGSLIEQAAPQGRQVVGQTFPAVPTFTVIWAHDHRGERVYRVFVVRVEGERVVALDYYRMADGRG